MTAMSDDRRLPYINPEVLIDEIKKRPLLYNAVMPDYNDRLKKLKVWQEISEVLVPNWKSLTASDRNLYIKEVQNKWRSIRDSFVKDYRRFKKSEMNGTKPPKRKKYIYYSRLTFLIDTLEKRKIIDQNHKNLPQDSPSEDDQEQPVVEEPMQVVVQPQKIAKPMMASKPNKHMLQQKAYPSVESEILDVLREVKERLPGPEEDEDRLFLLSLLSYFRKMDDDTRMSTRIQIMHCVHGAMTQMKEGLERDAVEMEHVEIECNDVKPFDMV